MPVWHFAKPRIPARAVVISIAALVVPFANTTLPRGAAELSGPLLWLLALVPAFLLAFYRGWRGVATALAAGMAALALSHSWLLLRSVPLNQPILLPIVASYIAIALATGWLSELLHDNRARAELQALTDDLTGLPNRRRIRMFLETQLAQATSSNPVSIVIFDLDNFKAYNDRHGHSAGDAVLCAFADVLAALTPAGDMPARYGGEEFMVVLSRCPAKRAAAFAERVRGGLAKTQSTSEGVTVSAGVSCYGPGFASANELIIGA